MFCLGPWKGSFEQCNENYLLASEHDALWKQADPTYSVLVEIGMETVKLERSRDGEQLKWRRAKMEMSQDADRLAGKRMDMRDEEVRREERNKEKKTRSLGEVNNRIGKAYPPFP